jgi:muscarinic acetylcholine receptor M3
MNFSMNLNSFQTKLTNNYCKEKLKKKMPLINFLIKTYISPLNHYLFILILFNIFQNTSALSLNFISDTSINNDNLIEENYLQNFNQSDYLGINSSDTNIYEDILPILTESLYPLPIKIIFYILATVTSLITIGGNLLVMLSFFLDRQIRNPTNYFLLSLSVSDFLIGVVSMPFMTIYAMQGVWIFGKIVCNLWLSLDYTICLTSIYTVFFITIDRFCSVKIPAKYRKWRTRKKIIGMVALTWVIPVAIFFPLTFTFAYTNNKEFNPINCSMGWNDDKWFNIIFTISYFWTVLVVMIVLYFFIYQVASNLEKKSRAKHRKISNLVCYNASNAAGALVAAGVVGTLNSKLTKISDLENLNEDNKILESFDSELKSKETKSSKLNYNNSNNNKNREHILEISSPVESKECRNDNLQSNDTEFKHVDKKLIDKEDMQNNYASSSFESHSDYESCSKSEKSQRKMFRSNLENQRLTNNQENLKTFSLNRNTVANKELNIKKRSSLELSEKLLNNKKTSQAINSKVSLKDNKKQQELIPFIDEEFDELGYILHKRQIDTENSTFKEETIVIKSSPLKQLFMQKIQSPLKSLSRKSSSKIFLRNNQTINHENLHINCDYNNDNNNEKKSILGNKNASISLSVSTPNTNSDSNTDSNANSIYAKNQDEVLSLSKDTKIESSKKSSHDYDSEDYEFSIKAKKNSTGKSFKKQSLLEKLKQKNSLKVVNNINNNNNNNNNNENKKYSISVTSKKVGINSPNDNDQNERNKRKLKYENRARKALRTITFILGAFVACFVPWHIISVWDSFCDKCMSTNNNYLLHIYNICYWLCYLNSPINPFMYASANQQFRKTFTRILKRDWRRL